MRLLPSTPPAFILRGLVSRPALIVIDRDPESLAAVYSAFAVQP